MSKFTLEKIIKNLFSNMASLRKRLEDMKDTQKTEEQAKTSSENKAIHIDSVVEESISDLSKIFPHESHNDIKKFVLQFSNRFEMNETVQSLLEEGKSIKDHSGSWNVVKSRDKKNKPAKYDQRGGKGKPRGGKFNRPQGNQYETNPQERSYRLKQLPNTQPKLPLQKSQEILNEPEPPKVSLQVSENSIISAPLQIQQSSSDLNPKIEAVQPAPVQKELPTPKIRQNYELDFPSSIPIEIRSDIIEEDLTLENKYSLYDEQQEANFKGVDFQVSKRTGDYERSIFSSAFREEIESFSQTEFSNTREIGVQTENTSSGINCTICPMSAEDLEKFAGFWEIFKKPSI